MRLWLVFFVAATACRRGDRVRRDPAPPVESRREVDPVDDAVYEAVLATEFRDPHGLDVVYLDRRTIRDHDCHDPSVQAEWNTEAAANWIVRNRTEVRIERPLRAPVAIEMLESEDFDEARGMNGVDATLAFYRMHPKRSVGARFSRVGYDATRTHALVDFTFDCTLCGHGARYALEHVGDRWVVVKSRTCWVS